VILYLGTTAPTLADGTGTESEGKDLLQHHCGRCHAIDNTGVSTMKNAPPLWEIYRDYPLERLEFELSEGIGSKHKEMPQIQFTSEQISAILTYLHTLLETK